MWFGGESAAAGGRAGRPRGPLSLSEPLPPAPLGDGGKRVLRGKVFPGAEVAARP